MNSMRRVSARVIVLALVLIGQIGAAPGAMACIWDSDSIRAEASGLPGIVDIITGRFERPPPAYFEIRLARASAAIASRPDDLEAYDDCASACDRLGRGVDAIEWMAKKKAVIDRMDVAAPRAKEHLYRYHANLGTFLAHDWLRSGADRDALDGLREGRDHIAKAIEINPDAHFGRERYQLMAMDWLLDPPPVNDVSGDLSSMFDRHLELRAGEGAITAVLWGRGGLKRAGFEDAAEGLAGLIALGAAWESVDVFYWLAIALEDRGDASLALLARLRGLELLGAGRRSLSPGGDDLAALERSFGRIGGSSSQRDEIIEFFPRARAQADARASRRAEFMTAQFAQGRHPDTNADFWAAFRDTPPPRMPSGFLGYAGPAEAVAVVIAGGGGVLGLLVAWRWRARRIRSRAALLPAS